MLSDFYRGRNVLITGHTGFKGSWLTFWLHRMGAEITGIALDPETGDGVFDATNIAGRCNDIRQDINDLEAVREIFADTAPETVFHLAAQPLVLRSYREPAETFRTNILGTVNILEAIRQTPSVRSAVIVTTDKCYENNEIPYGYKEDDRLGGKDPYSASKASAELVTGAYRHSFFSVRGAPGIATARAGNVIGGGDWAENRLIPDCIRSIKAGKAVEIRNPDSVRPWQHVLDPLHGYLLLGKLLAEDPNGYAEAWNFGPEPGNLTPVKEITETIFKTMEKGEWRRINSDPSRPEASLLLLDITKSLSRLGWKPLIGTSEAVRLTAEWYFHQMKGSEMSAVTSGQIDHFETL